jgi:hypothetical protein
MILFLNGLFKSYMLSLTLSMKRLLTTNFFLYKDLSFPGSIVLTRQCAASLIHAEDTTCLLSFDSLRYLMEQFCTVFSWNTSKDGSSTPVLHGG